MLGQKKSDILKGLQADILRLQGFNEPSSTLLCSELGPMTSAFPNGSFPLGAVHEFLSTQTEDAASVSGFVAALLSSLIGSEGATLWISASRKLFPPALRFFGLQPDHFIFLDLQKEKDVLWAVDEALKCSALSAVIGEVRELDFTTSRRLQLSVEQSKVTGFLLRSNYRELSTTACVSRWRVTPLPSELKNLPGIGFPRWRVELLKMRNGKTGAWNMEWVNGKFTSFQFDTERTLSVPHAPLEKKKAG